jgi:hypothetical protein
MILRFMDKFPDGSGTYFEEKLNHIKSPHRNMFVGPRGEIEVFPKIHTIRKDELNRWKPGRPIQGYYHPRTKRMRKIFEGECKSVQGIEIKHDKHQPNLLPPKVYVESSLDMWRELNDFEIETLAINDGLTVEQFFTWFNEDFEGKIIHFTDLKY